LIGTDGVPSVIVLLSDSRESYFQWLRFGWSAVDRIRTELRNVSD